MTARLKPIRTVALAAGFVIAMAATSLATKPTAPVVVRARLVETDFVAGTAQVRIEARALIKADAVSIRCQLPDGSAMVPGTGEWSRGKKGEKILTVRVTLPPKGGKLIVRADLSGKGIKTGVIGSLMLPSRSGKARPKPTGTVIKTNKGERLRIHK
jgi:hypothetical protein